MNYGLYISASGLLTSMSRQDTLTSNLANVNTTGFKPLVPTVRHRDPVTVEDNLPHLPSSQLLEQLGAGALLGPSHISFKPGPLIEGGELDVAIDGEGFFAVDGGADGPRLTRDGRLALDSAGRLVQAASGRAMLGAGGQPIVLPPDATIEVDPDGRIYDSEGRVLAQLQLLDVADRLQLAPIGEGMFAAPASALESPIPATGRVVHRRIESSAVDPITALRDISSAASAASANAAMIDFQDRLMDRAINALGRVT